MDDPYHEDTTQLFNTYNRTQNLAGIFYIHAQQHPKKTALICGNDIINYHTLASRAIELTHVLSISGVKRGDHIAVLLPNSIEFVCLMIAASDIGAVLVPLNTALTPASVWQAFGVADVKHVIGRGALLEPLLPNIHELDQKPDGLWLSTDKRTEGTVFLGDITRTVGALAMPLNTGEWHDAMILTMTSGSTGSPKPIVLTQWTKYQRAVAAVTMYQISPQDITLAATPLYHSLAERLVLIPLLTGGTSVLMPNFSVDSWFEIIAAHKVSFSIAVSSQLVQIAKTLDIAERPANIESLRCIVSSSALLDTAIKSRLIEQLNCEFHECYGTSEIAIASNLAPSQTGNKLASVGTAAHGVNIRIINEEGKELGVNEIGEIVCQTPMRFSGYYKLENLTSQAMWGDFFKTGDLGKLDKDGFLYFMGRKKDIIISGGINIYPVDIESVLLTMPEISECAAFAYPDEKLGEVIALAIVPKSDSHLNLRALRHYCATQLADFQQPRKFFVVDSLPKNSMGKLMKFELVKRYREGAAS